MTRSIDDEPDTHTPARELLPWLVNRTADGEPQAEAARAHVAGCAECREWHRFDERLQDALRQERVVDFSPHAAYATFAGRLDAEQARQERWPPWRRPLAGWLSSPRERLVRFALVAQFTVIAVLATGLALRPGPDAAREYRTLSVPEASTAAPEELRLRLVVDETMSAVELRELLAASHARIVDGPTELGVFTIAVQLADAAAQDGVTLARLLRAQPGVRFAEPVLRPPEAR
jgi:hypothetical protein